MNAHSRNSLWRFIMTVVMVIPLILAACGESIPELSVQNTLYLAAGSENRALEPILQRFAKDQGNNVNLRIEWKGSVQLMYELKAGKVAYDAIWMANTLWFDLGKNTQVQNPQSIYKTPVVLGVRRSLAQQLGWVGKDVHVSDILAAVEAGRLRLGMASATQSNSGASAYLGFLSAFTGNPEVLTAEHVRHPEVAAKVTRILSGVNRSSGSTGFLKDLYLQDPSQMDAVVLYEALVIEANKELTAKRQEPLYVVYPIDGLSIADAPLAYVNQGNETKAAIVDKLKAYLRSEPIQKEILQLGRRSGDIGSTIQDAPKDVFNPDWGINTTRTLPVIKTPRAEVINEALVLYQTVFRKPSFAIFCLDISGSMAGGPEQALRDAMVKILDPQEASKILIQRTPQDRMVVLTFDHKVQYESRMAIGPEIGTYLLSEVPKWRTMNGGTNMYECLKRAASILNSTPGLSNYSTAMVVMTDGKSDDAYGNYRQHVEALQRTQGSPLTTVKVPIYSIKFGAANETQLKQLERDTRGKVFDGKDLTAAMREVMGYT